MALDFTQLEAAVTEDESVDSSAAQLITALAKEVEDNKNDPIALQKFVDRLRTTSATLSAAVAANTKPPQG